MLRRAPALLLILLAAAGCGGGDGDDARRTAATPTATPSSAPAAPTGDQLPTSPQVDLKGADLPAFRGGRATAPETAGGAASVVGTIRRPEELQGRAGVFCRGHELTVDRRGRARLERVEGGRRTLTSKFPARIDAASPPGTPVPLTLVCGPGEAGEVVLGFSVGAQELTYVRERGELRGDSAGLVARSRGDERRFAALQLYLAG